jgi:hypothetical protein
VTERSAREVARMPGVLRPQTIKPIAPLAVRSSA